MLINRGKGFQVEKLTHSHPFVTPRSKVVLEELGEAFQELSKDESFFTITSVTRTPEQQQKLRKRNRNATAGISSHSYGVSFDISYIRFDGKKGGNRSAQKDLESVLNEFQAANKIFFIKERKQSCYHITVRWFFWECENRRPTLDYLRYSIFGIRCSLLFIGLCWMQKKPPFSGFF